MMHFKTAVSKILSTHGRGVPDFVWNILELKNINHSTLDVYYDFLIDYHDVVDGDVVELGVFRGASLISTALLLKSFGSNKKVYGFDSFSGFPSFHPNDDKSVFERLHKQGRISEEHYQWVLFKQDSESLFPREHNFDNTTLDFVKSRIKLFDLDNIELITGDLTHNLEKLPKTIMAGLFDCDLYLPYKDALPAIYEKLADRGLIYLDEYYSLKYPGPRLAVDEFCAASGLKPIKSSRLSQGEFERWYIERGPRAR